MPTNPSQNLQRWRLCEHCGAHMPEIAAFCPQCGRPMPERRLYGPPADSSYPQPPAGFDVYRAPATRTRPPEDVPQPATSRGASRQPAVTLGLSLLMYLPIVVMEIVGYALATQLGLDENLCVTVVSCVAAVLGVIVMGGHQLLRIRGSKLLEMLRQGWWALAVSAALAIYDIVSSVADGSFVLADDWVLRALGTLVLCLAIGYEEESMFRGLLLHGLLDPMGRRKGGIWGAVIISSILFGLAHIIGEELLVSNPLTILEALLKTIQTGTYGFFLAGLVIRTHDLNGAALLHGFDDFLLLLPTSIMGYSFDTDYVATGSEEAMGMVILYLIIIVLYIPLVVRGVRMLRQETAPNQGAFHRA